MAMTPLLGTRSIASADADMRGKAWLGLARLVEARENQLAVLTSLMRTRPTTDIEINWFERDVEPFEVLSDGAASSSATSLVFDDGASGGVNFNFRNGTLIKNDRSEEIVLISADPAANTGAVTVIRNFGDNGAKPTQDDDRWTIIGMADEDNKPSPKAISFNPERKTNFLQLMREPIDLGLMASATEFRTGSEYNRLRKDAFLQFVRRWERQFVHGQPKDSAGSTSDVRRTQTGGILNPITTNFKNFGGPVSELSFDKEVEKGFRFGARRKVAVCGGIASNVVNSIAKFSGGTIHEYSGDEVYGLEINEYRHVSGRLMMLYTPALGISTNWADTMVVIDTLQLSRAVFPGLDLKLRKNVQEAGVLGIKDELIMAAGLILGLQKHHSFWRKMASFQA